MLHVHYRPSPRESLDRSPEHSFYWTTGRSRKPWSAVGQWQCTEAHTKGSYGNFSGGSRRGRDAHARVPSTAASATAQACRLDGVTHTRRLRDPIQVRCKTRKAFQHSRYMRPTALVNLCRSTRRAGKVGHMSCAIGLTAATHLSYVPSEHPFMLELASSRLRTLP